MPLAQAWWQFFCIATNIPNVGIIPVFLSRSIRSNIEIPKTNRYDAGMIGAQLLFLSMQARSTMSFWLNIFSTHFPIFWQCVSKPASDVSKVCYCQASAGACPTAFNHCPSLEVSQTAQQDCKGILLQGYHHVCNHIMTGGSSHFKCVLHLKLVRWLFDCTRPLAVRETLHETVGKDICEFFFFFLVDHLLE